MLNTRFFEKLGEGGVHSPAPDSLSDAYTNLAPTTDTDTGETTPEKYRYEEAPGSNITFHTLLQLDPKLKDKLKEIYKKFKRPNWTEVKHK
jgi:hypothetical protein